MAYVAEMAQSEVNFMEGGDILFTLGEAFTVAASVIISGHNNNNNRSSTI
jgi:hypothetical protein